MGFSVGGGRVDPKNRQYPDRKLYCMPLPFFITYPEFVVAGGGMSLHVAHELATDALLAHMGVWTHISCWHGSTQHRNLRTGFGVTETPSERATILEKGCKSGIPGPGFRRESSLNLCLGVSDSPLPMQVGI